MLYDELIPPGDIPALGGEARHAQTEPRGVLGPGEEHQRPQILLRRARDCEADHAELNQSTEPTNLSYRAV